MFRSGPLNAHNINSESVILGCDGTFWKTLFNLLNLTHFFIASLIFKGSKFVLTSIKEYIDSTNHNLLFDSGYNGALFS